MYDELNPTDLEIEFGEFIADISACFYHCSYNDLDVLEGVLADKLKEKLNNSVLDDSFVQFDNDPQKIQNRVVEFMTLTGGWPLDTLTCVTPFKKLHQKYIDVFIENNRMDLLEIKVE